MEAWRNCKNDPVKFLTHCSPLKYFSEWPKAKFIISLRVTSELSLKFIVDKPAEIS